MQLHDIKTILNRSDGNMATRPSGQSEFLYSSAVRTSAAATFGLGTNLSWDAYQRQIYNQQNALFTRQANELLRRGFVTPNETRALVEQRNMLVRDSRRPLSPFGRLYSEILKPSYDLPTYERLLRTKGSNEPILQSVGGTRVIVNRISFIMRYAGRGMVLLNVTVSAVIIARASPEDRARVATRQGATLAGGIAGGWSGAWAGCAGAALIASPSLVVPVVGEIGTGGACLIGGIFGGLGGGAVGAWLGDRAGGAAYDFISRLEWRG